MVGVTKQRAALEALVAKHLGADGLSTFRAEELRETEAELGFGVSGPKHDKLVAALEVLTDYQLTRRARSHLRVRRAPWKRVLCRQSKENPRIRMIELLKRWLRVSVVDLELEEHKLRQLSNLTRDLLNYRELFPSTNSTNFIAAVGKAHAFLTMQLRDVVQEGTTCGRLAQQVLEAGKDLISTCAVVLLLGPTDFKQTDELNSLQVVALWESLPREEATGLPINVDVDNAKAMRGAWHTSYGALLAALLGSHCFVQLFAGVGAADAATDSFPAALRAAEQAFGQSSLCKSGLAGPFRTAEAREARRDVLRCVQDLYNFAWLLSEVFPHFKRVSDNLGDYGMICMSSVLRPFLALLAEKVLQLKASLESVNEAVLRLVVMPTAVGHRPARPVPSAKMARRSFDAIERAVLRQGDCVAESLLDFIGRLQDRADPGRLPELMTEVGEDIAELRDKVSSPEFRECVGAAGAAALEAAVAGEAQAPDAASRGEAAVAKPSPQSWPLLRTPSESHSESSRRPQSWASTRVPSESRSPAPRAHSALSSPRRSPGAPHRSRSASRAGVRSSSQSLPLPHSRHGSPGLLALAPPRAVSMSELSLGSSHSRSTPRQ